MGATVIDGKALAAATKAEAAEKVRELKSRGINPCLAVILVGENPASQVYVRGKINDCAQCGIESRSINLPADTTQDALLAEVKKLADDSAVHGILVQLPLPAQIDEKAVIDAIPPEKDVDGFSPVNVGRMQIGELCYLPCTPAGCIRMIESTGTDIAGKNAVVIGRSNIVGKPAALLLLAKNATVTICHSRTKNLKEVCAAADILVAAVGREAANTPRALLVSVSALPRLVQERNLDELAALAHTAGLTVAGRMVQRVTQVNPRLILGKGKVAELEVQALQGRADMLVFDGELAPAQLHNLADITERKVMDRTQLILDIFAQHAVTRAGKLQVELAQLRYTQPRLVGKNRAMDRLMGGIGGRGPGETKLETDRRKIRERMARIRTALDQLRRQRAFTRARRARQGLPVAALVGYTNAGKSTLLNTLTRSEVLAENKLFATLDPTTRRLRFPAARELVLADTVGFIRNLPKELTEAFQATLEELESADLLLHVADAAHPDLLQQIAAVEDTLTQMDLDRVPRLLLLNKWDQLAAPGQDLIFCRKCGNINTEKVQKNSPGRAFSAPRRVIFLFYLPSSSRTALRNPAASRSMRRSSSRRFPW